jgi:hypothetical protein
MPEIAERGAGQAIGGGWNGRKLFSNRAGTPPENAVLSSPPHCFSKLHSMTGDDAPLVLAGGVQLAVEKFLEAEILDFGHEHEDLGPTRIPRRHR